MVYAQLLVTVNVLADALERAAKKATVACSLKAIVGKRIESWGLDVGG